MGSGQIAAQVKTFTVSYGNTSYNEGIASFQLPDSTYLTVGNASGFSSSTAPYLARIATDGTLMYDVMVSRPFLSSIRSAAIQDTFLYLAGFALIQGDYQYLLIKTDLNGNLVMEKTWGGAGWDFINDLVVTEDDTVFFCGESSDSVYGQRNATAGCLSPAGILQWQESYGGNGYDAFMSIDTAHQSTLIMAGCSSSLGTMSDSALFIVNTSRQGSVLWQKFDDAPGFDRVHDIHSDLSGGYYLCGQTARWPSFGLQGFLMYVDATGQLQWTAQFSDPEDDGLYSAMQLSDTSYRMTGFNQGVYSSGKKDVMVQNADKHGYWTPGLTSFGWGYMQDDIGYHIIHTLDDGFLITGTSRSIPSYITSIVLIKSDFDGNHSPYAGHATGIASPMNPTETILLFPNPAETVIHLKHGLWCQDACSTVTVSDLSGRVIKTFHVNLSAPGDVSLSVEDLSPGTYLLRVTDRVLKFQKL